MSSGLEDVLYGALAGGVNGTTFVVINAIFFVLFLSLAGLLALAWVGHPEIIPHIAFLIFIFLGLAVGLNWLIAQVGLRDAKAQRKELHLDDDWQEVDPAEAVAAAAAAAEEEEKDQGAKDGKGTGTKKDI